MPAASMAELPATHLQSVILKPSFENRKKIQSVALGSRWKNNKVVSGESRMLIKRSSQSGELKSREACSFSFFFDVACGCALRQDR